jgi:tRNA threonylcarbamoyl adenosine modification protein (Sua5/YciO/YrdC/YwlC family)
VLALPPGTVDGALRLTEQGEVIASKYADPESGRRNLETLAAAALEASLAPRDPRERSRRHTAIMEELSTVALRAYRGLVTAPGFVEYFHASTPIAEIAELNPAAAALARAFWPGGLTLVLPLRADRSLPPALGGDASITHPTVGLRVPDHEAPRALARAVGPLPTTSANRSGEPEARDADELEAQLGGALDVILDGGPAHGGPASTVVDATTDPVRILREGAVSNVRIDACLTSADLPGVGR